MKCNRNECTNIVGPSGKKYCSRSCAATVNNKLSPKRNPQGKCKACGEPIVSSRWFCSQKCWNRKARVDCKSCKEPLDKNSNEFCTKHYKEKMKKYMTERYHRRRNEFIQFRGGKCEKCGSFEQLEIDHVEPELKTYNIGTILSGGSEEKVKKELAKCQILCSSCHKIKSSFDNGVPHGGGSQGKRGCKCQECKAKKSEYSREYKLRKKSTL